MEGGLTLTVIYDYVPGPRHERSGRSGVMALLPS